MQKPNQNAAYEPPKLQVIGTFQELTLGSKSRNADQGQVAGFRNSPS